jgi:uncharacterized membrane protein
VITNTKAGIFFGALLAVVWFVVGFWAFLVVAIAMAIGALVGRFVDGKLDVKTLTDAFRGKRSSS